MLKTCLLQNFKCFHKNEWEISVGKEKLRLACALNIINLAETRQNRQKKQTELQRMCSNVKWWFYFQDLYQRCEKMRPTLFRLASDTEDNDEALGRFGFDVGFESHGGDADQFPPHSRYPAGKRQLDAGHQSVQAAGEGGGGDKRRRRFVLATRCAALFPRFLLTSKAQLHINRCLISFYSYFYRL